MNVTESKHLVTLLRWLEPGSQVSDETAAEAVEYLARRACETLQIGLLPFEARALFEAHAARAADRG